MQGHYVDGPVSIRDASKCRSSPLFHSSYPMPHGTSTGRWFHHMQEIGHLFAIFSRYRWGWTNINCLMMYVSVNTRVWESRESRLDQLYFLSHN